MIARYALAWFPMVFLAVANGVLREKTFAKTMTGLHANQLSVFTGIMLFGLYTWFISWRWPLASARQAVAVGLIWLALTVGFEFLFGHYVLIKSWNTLLADYDVLQGRLWVLVLAAVACLPWIVFKSRS